MKLGFTGTQRGMTPKQQLFLGLALVKLRPKEFHHGCCVGADEQAHRLVRKLPFFVKIVGHPPLNRTKQANVTCDEYRVRKDYLIRNHDVVDETDLLIATPKEEAEVLRSGTWATVRYARKVGGKKRVKVIAP